jgi:flagellar biosynthesis protein FliQ
MDYLMEHLRQGILLSLMLSMPSILSAAAVGLVVGILQAVTQVQEQTLSAVPKLIFVFVILIVTGATMLEMSGNYIRESAQIAFQTVPSMGHFVMPPRPKHDGYLRGRFGGQNTVKEVQAERERQNETKASKRVLEQP